MVLEEKYFAEDMFGLKKAEVSNTNRAVTLYKKKHKSCDGNILSTTVLGTLFCKLSMQATTMSEKRIYVYKTKGKRGEKKSLICSRYFDQIGIPQGSEL